MSSAMPAAGAGESSFPGAGFQACVRVAVLVCLFSAGAWHEAIHCTSLLNPDVWIHLRTGQWILQSHGVPHTALFTRHSELQWAVPSWGFDLLLAVAARIFDLRAIPLALMVFKTALAIATFSLSRGWRGNFWGAVCLTAVVQYCLLAFPPLPAMVSALFIAVELYLLFESRTAGGARYLRWLPALFLLWANLDVQFLNGLLVLGLFAVSSLLNQWLNSRAADTPAPELPLRPILLFSGLSALATLFSPYFYAPYLAVLQAPVGRVGLSVLDSLHSMNFRHPQHYVLLLLTLLAFFALGRRRARDWFEISLIAVCAPIAFHWQQDMWFIALPAAAVIAQTFPGNAARPDGKRAWPFLSVEGIAVATLTVVLIAVAGARIPSEQVLLSKVSVEFPVKAADYIRQNHLQGPLYNAQAWGGFLTWYLPEYPVSIDGRIEMYGPRINDPFFETSTGLRRVQDDADFAVSQTFLLKRESRLYDAATHLPGFQILYEDDLAAVIEAH